ncbi:MAG: CDP-alcohol phosphatidyltransferase family protein [Candidatus Sulfotelmatobacter sp.]
MSAPISVSEYSQQPFVAATRLQESLVAPAEKQVLAWLATRTPAWINSDHLTMLGFFSQCFVGVCYALSRLNPDMLIVGVACMALNWLGDSLDGTLARIRNRQRPRYGFYVDHISDTIAAFFLTGGLALSGYVHPVIAFGMLIAFLMLSIESYLATYTLGKFRLSYWIFGPTEIRILLALGNLALLRHSTVTVFHHRVLLFDCGGLIAIAGMSTMLIISTIRHTAKLYRQERVR